MNKLIMFVCIICFISIAQESDSLEVSLKKLSLKTLQKVKIENGQLLDKAKSEIAQISNEIVNTGIDSIYNFLDTVDNGIVKVNVFAVVVSPFYLYSLPSFQSKTMLEIGEIKQGEVLHCKGLEKNFVLVEKNNKDGYVYRDNLDFRDTSLTVVVKYDVNLKLCAKLQKILRKLKCNIGENCLQVNSQDISFLKENGNIIAKEKIDQVVLLAAKRDSIENIKTGLISKDDLISQIIPLAERKDSLSIKYKTSKYKNAIIDGKIRIGMTKNMVLDSWGEPKDINRTVGKWGVHEQWVYEDTYLYFENGELTSFQD